MSTRGVLIIRKDGRNKAMGIGHDAYPEGAGIDAVDLVKTTDLHLLYNLMTEYDEWDISEENLEEYPGEPYVFDYATCILAVKKNKKIWVSPETVEDIRNSLFCEHAYVIDIDREQLLYYIGSQKAPFEGNTYGTEPVMLPGMCEAYYPCMLSAGFSFQYVRAAKSEHVADEMKSSKKDKEHIQIYDVKRLKEGRAGKNDYYADITSISAGLYALNKKMVSILEGLSDCHPTSENRIHDLQGAVALTGKAIRELEKQVEIIK